MGERLRVLSESRVREIRLLGSMKRDVETESWNLDCGTANRKGRQQLRGTYRHRATSRLYHTETSGRIRAKSVPPLTTDMSQLRWHVGLVPCVDGSELARAFFTFCSIGRCSHVFGLLMRFT